MKTRVWQLLLVSVLALAVAACGGDDDGTNGDDNGDTATQTAAGTGPIALSSEAFASGQPIPVEYTCDGDNISPPLSWAGVPEGTESIAVEMVDPDAGDYVHWVLYDLPAGVTGLPSAVPPEATVEFDSRQAINTAGEIGYSGPCPPEGEDHQYVFRVYALDALLGIAGGGSARNVQDALADHTLALSELAGTYSR